MGSKDSLVKNDNGLGQYGEVLVANYLRKRNFIVLAKNYRSKLGEVDLIAQKSDLIIFIEVKLRREEYFNISEVINLSKQRKIILAARSFIFKNKLWNFSYRFDVALLLRCKNSYNIEYIDNAFTQRE